MLMQLHELLNSGVLLEMAYTQKKAERVITGLEKPFNDGLLKLWTIPDSFQQPDWTDDLVNWIDEIGEIVFRPANVRPPHIFYYKLLFFEPFGGDRVAKHAAPFAAPAPRRPPLADQLLAGCPAVAASGVSPRSVQSVRRQTDAGGSDPGVPGDALARAMPAQNLA